MSRFQRHVCPQQIGLLDGGAYGKGARSLGADQRDFSLQSRSAQLKTTQDDPALPAPNHPHMGPYPSPFRKKPVVSLPACKAYIFLKTNANDTKVLAHYDDFPRRATLPDLGQRWMQK